MALKLSQLDGRDGFRLTATRPMTSAAIRSAGAGDFNGDGIDDLVIGAPGWGFSSGTGQSYVVFGSAGGFDASLDLATLDGTNGFRLDGIAAGDRSGYSVAAAGDVNGDGVDDLSSIGAPNAGENYAGESYLVFGTAERLRRQPRSRVPGRERWLPPRRAKPMAKWLFGRRCGRRQRRWLRRSDHRGAGRPDIGTSAGASYVVFGSAPGFGRGLDLAALDGENGFRLAGLDPIRPQRLLGGGRRRRQRRRHRRSDRRRSGLRYEGASYVVFGNRRRLSPRASI